MKLPKQVLPVCHDSGYEYRWVNGRIEKVRIPQQQLTSQSYRKASAGDVAPGNGSASGGGGC